MPIRILYKYKLKKKSAAGSSSNNVIYLRRVLQRRYLYGSNVNKDVDVNYITEITILSRIYNREEDPTYWALSEHRDERIYKLLAGLITVKNK